MWLLKKLFPLILTLTKPRRNREEDSHLKKILPFALALLAGVSWLDVIQKGLHKLTETEVVEAQQSQKQEQELNRDLEVLSVPAMDFTDEARRSWGFTATIKLDAEFGADGKISNIKPSTVLDLALVWDGSKLRKVKRPKPFYFDRTAVNALPFNLLETAVEATKGIQFKPQVKNGVPVSTKVRIVFDFVLSSSVETPGSFIKTSINEIWHNEQYVQDTYDRYDPMTGKVFING